MKKYLWLTALTMSLFFGACGDEGGTNAGGDDDESSSSVVSSDSEGSSSSAKKESSSSTVKSSSSVASSSSAKSSSSSVIGSQAESSGDACIDIAEAQCQGSESKSSSSSAKSSSSSAKSSSSSAKSSSSSSEYVPFDHSVALAASYKVGKDAYKQFTDERNGRSYYYITIAGKDTSGKDNSVTVMAENLNVGEMVRGIRNQDDDEKIERYCYRNDTTNCDRYGGLYQWAEMMALPSECNTKSCADQIKENHQGICPTGWRLLTYNDFYTILHANTNDDGVKGLRSSYQFSGSNYSGFSLTGGGLKNKDGNFEYIGEGAYWFYPVEFGNQPDIGAYSNGIVSTGNFLPGNDSGEYKKAGLSVRCVKVE
ncbi:MAG: hypothetical protein MJZ25_13545 [Fibrobacter sp.]|nr:hypothetical protein [Fibrobacter sp.]